MSDMLEPEMFASLLERNIKAKNHLLTKVYGGKGLDYESILQEYRGYAEALAGYVTDDSLLINEALEEGKKVLFEGAQGTLLDIDHGTYPYVTSSHPTAGGACLGAGIGPTKIDKVIGVAKAYITRVGEGPFVTELKDATGDYIRTKGGEFGTTTGRPRRCGWFDAVVARYAARINGLSYLAVTKLDVLSGLDKVKICTAYSYRGKLLKEFPASLKVLIECVPVYEEFDGWHEDITSATSLEELPASARQYLERISQVAGVPIALVGVGSKRSQTIKISSNPDKVTTPGFKTVYRIVKEDTGKAVGDYIAMLDEDVRSLKRLKMFDPVHTWLSKDVTNFKAVELLEPVFIEGKQVRELPSLQEIKEYHQNQLSLFWPEYLRKLEPEIYPVDLSEKVWHMKRELIEHYTGVLRS
jgi:hypothetical protein